MPDPHHFTRNSLTNLSLESLDMIVSEAASINDQKSLRLTCKALASVATRYVFQEVHLTEHIEGPSSNTGNPAKDLLTVLEANEVLSRYIKSLTLDIHLDGKEPAHCPWILADDGWNNVLNKLTALQSVVLIAHPGELMWDRISKPVAWTFEALFEQVKCLEFHGIEGIPLELILSNKNLKKLSIVDGDFQGHCHSVPDVKTLEISPTALIRYQALLTGAQAIHQSSPFLSNLVKLKLSLSPSTPCGGSLPAYQDQWNQLLDRVKGSLKVLEIGPSTSRWTSVSEWPAAINLIQLRDHLEIIHLNELSVIPHQNDHLNTYSGIITHSLQTQTLNSDESDYFDCTDETPETDDLLDLSGPSSYVPLASDHHPPQTKTLTQTQTQTPDSALQLPTVQTIHLTLTMNNDTTIADIGQVWEDLDMDEIIQTTYPELRLLILEFKLDVPLVSAGSQPVLIAVTGKDLERFIRRVLPGTVASRSVKLRIVPPSVLEENIEL